MRNLDWFKKWNGERVKKMSDFEARDLIERLLDGRRCKICETLFGKCTDEDDHRRCSERLAEWGTLDQEIELQYNGVTGVYRYDKDDQVYNGVTVSGTGRRVIPFYGKTLEDLDYNFRRQVDRYKVETERDDEELRKLEGLPTIQVFRDGEVTAIMPIDFSGAAYLTLVYRGVVEMAEYETAVAAFEHFLEFSEEKRGEIKKNDTIQWDEG